ncbi:hypothetical protein F8S13_03345 [Chloroflexia bacterium SDU3-3]|nr:hypothetical protein F8S13_03345 [Chloroflexia bacterium SDU3-3]
MSIVKPQTTSLIDTLTQGFSTINRRLWVLIIPILLNVYFWYGPQVSLAPLTEGVLNFFEQQAEATGQTAAAQAYDSMRVMQQADLIQQFDMVGLVPRLSAYAVSGAQDGGLPLPGEVWAPLQPQRVVWTATNGSLAALLFLLITFMRIPLGVLFMSMLAGAVLAERESLRAWAVRTGLTGASLLGYLAILLAAILVLLVPLAFVAALFTLVVPLLGSLALLVLFTAVFWVRIYIGFTPEAIAVGRLDTIKALRTSYQMVRQHFWATIGLLALSFVISVGMGVLWGLLVGNTIGLILAVVGSAYIGCGLGAARMIFFRERATIHIPGTSKS